MDTRELLPTNHLDRRGYLRVYDLPFQAVRCFTISEVPEGESRGSHAHRLCRQLFLCTSGSYQLDISSPDDTVRSWKVSKGAAIEVPPGLWVVLSRFSRDGVAVVLCDRPYEGEDIVVDYETFRREFA